MGKLPTLLSTVRTMPFVSNVGLPAIQASFRRGGPLPPAQFAGVNVAARTPAD
jgi:hypothetical protein